MRGVPSIVDVFEQTVPGARADADEIRFFNRNQDRIDADAVWWLRDGDDILLLASPDHDAATISRGDPGFRRCDTGRAAFHRRNPYP